MIKVRKNSEEKVKTNESLELRLDDIVNKVCTEIIIDLSNSNSDIEVIKIKYLNKENTQSFKRKYCKKSKYLFRQTNKEEGNKNETIELITELMKDMIDNSIEIVNDLDEILSNTIRD